MRFQPSISGRSTSARIGVARTLVRPLVCAVALALGATAPALRAADEGAVLDRLVQSGQQIEAAAKSDDRQDSWTAFLDESAPIARAHPDRVELWRLRAVAALEVNQPRLGRESARHLLAAAAPSAATRATLDKLEGRGWTLPLKIRTQLPAGAALPASWAGKSIKAGDTGIKLRWVKPGAFRMGTASNNPGGRIVHVTRGYWLGETEVTQAQWQHLMGDNPSNFQLDHRLAEQRGETIVGDDRPVEQVSWAQATEYCRRLNASEGAAGRLPPGYEYRLPTEAEWEYAARAGVDGDYRDGLPKIGWFDENSHDITHEVGEKRVNAWGFVDMAGNVAEWCYDWFQELDNEETTDWAVLDPDPEELSGATRVIRGGSWLAVAPRCQPSYRLSDDPGNTLSYVGFRLALAPKLSND